MEVAINKNMKFKKWLQNRVCRADAKKIDFSDPKGMRQYFLLGNGNQSGPTPSHNKKPKWAKNKKGKFKTGLYAGKFEDIISYTIPRDIPWLVTHDDSKDKLYIHKKDLARIKKYRPWITCFDKQEFKPLSRKGQGEYFTEKPPVTQKQMEIKDPFSLLKSRFEIVLVDDLLKKFQELKKKKIKFDAEGDMFV